MTSLQKFVIVKSNMSGSIINVATKKNKNRMLKLPIQKTGWKKEKVLFGMVPLQWSDLQGHQ